MKERSILFSTDMVNAILDGRKTMTRRVIKPQPDSHGYWLHKDGHKVHKQDLYLCCSYGEIGDRLWVRETWNEIETASKSDLNFKHYKYVYYANYDDEYPGISWRPSIFMPRKASRINLEITNIRVERLHDITNEDVLKEGFCKEDVLAGEERFSWFVKLWDSINVKRGYGWNVNPWVWVISFKSLTINNKE